MDINYSHPLYLKRLEQWTKIEDITRLENLGRYLIPLNPLDDSKENQARNEQYRKRAIFYAITQQTTQGMVGSIFRKWPTMQVPSELEYLKQNADGAGVSIYQSSQGCCDDVLRKGRAGLYVHFPKTEGEVKRQDILDGRYVATITRFEPEQIINWRVEQDGSRAQLTLVVTKEKIEVPGPSGYAVEFIDMYREMFMDYKRDSEGEIISERKVEYRERIWKKGLEKALEISEVYTPLDAKGKPWEYIPFTFIGSENNDSTPDMPPSLGMVELNIGHYRNSADYEDSCWYTGQAQPWMSGLTQDYIDLMKKNQMYVGSRNLMGVPSGETYGIAQAEPNTMVKEAMDGKVVAMIQLGARLMEVGSATKTATQAEQDRESSTSLLGLVASNVSEAYTQALKWACRYMGANDKDVHYTLSQEFVSMKATPQELQQVVMGFIQGAIPLNDYTRTMRKFGYFDDDTPDDDYAELLARPSVE